MTSIATQLSSFRGNVFSPPSDLMPPVLMEPESSSKYLKTGQDPIFTPECHDSFGLDSSEFRIFRQQSNSHASSIWVPSNSQVFYNSIDSFHRLNLLSWEGPTVFPIKIVKKIGEMPIGKSYLVELENKEQAILKIYKEPHPQTLTNALYNYCTIKKIKLSSVIYHDLEYIVKKDGFEKFQSLEELKSFTENHMAYGYHLCESGISQFPRFDESCYLKPEVHQSIYSQLADMFKILLDSGIPVPLKRENVGIRLCKNTNSDGSEALTCQVVYLYPTVIPKVDVEENGNLFKPLLEECLESFASKGSILYNFLNPQVSSQ